MEGLDSLAAECVLPIPASRTDLWYSLNQRRKRKQQRNNRFSHRRIGDPDKQGPSNDGQLPILETKARWTVFEINQIKLFDRLLLPTLAYVGCQSK
jgi:hypothetical protein